MSKNADKYYLGIQGRQSGPFSEFQVRDKIARGEVQADDLCWLEGWPEWRPLSAHFPGFPVFPLPVAPSPEPMSSPLVSPPREVPTPFVTSEANPTAGARPPWQRSAISHSVSTEGRDLVVPRDAEFPRICLMSGATEDLIEVPIRRQLTWHHPAVYLAILLNLLVYAILALIVRKKSSHRFYLSRTEKARHANWHRANWLIFLGSFGMFFAAGASDRGELVLVGLAGLLASIVIYVAKVRLLQATRIDDTYTWVRGIPRHVLPKVVEAWH